MVAVEALTRRRWSWSKRSMHLEPGGRRSGRVWWAAWAARRCATRSPCRRTRSLPSRDLTLVEMCLPLRWAVAAAPL